MSVSTGHRSLAQCLHAPQSIALIGASDDASKTSGRPQQYLKRAGYRGVVYPINPGRRVVQGQKAWPSVTELPSVPDHAFVLTSTEGAIPAVTECARIGVPVVTILASGFSDGGITGEQLTEQLKEACKGSTLRILGPSSLGIVNLHENTIITANAAFAETELPRGGIFLASHSGSLLGGLISRSKERGLGFAGLVSVGNEIDLSLGEVCSTTLDDPNVTGYMLFLESIRHADKLRAFAGAAADRGKPVVAYKLGRSAAAAELALSHTGALAGEDDIATAFLADCGIARVAHLEALFEAMPLLHRVPPRNRSTGKGRIGVVTTTGGGAAMIVDELTLRGMEVVEPGNDTMRRLKESGIQTQQGLITDLTLAGTRYDVMKSALDVMLSAPEFDMIVAVVGSSARFNPELAVKPVIDSASSDKPIVAFIVPEAPVALKMLAEASVPNFRTPESCADAICAVLRRRTPVGATLPSGHVSAGAGRQVDELAAYGILAKVGLPHVESISMPVSIAVMALPFAYPVAVKVLSAEIAHKTDLGGVVLNVKDDAELKQAILRIERNVKERHPQLPIDEVLVQPMVSGLGELLLGYRIDPDAGPIVMLAAGGIYTEIYKDRSIRLAPVSIEVAREMVDELAISAIFKGFRNKPVGDLEAVARAIVSMSNLASTSVREAEVNPLIVQPDGRGVVAIDALVSVSDASGKLTHGRGSNGG